MSIINVHQVLTGIAVARHIQGKIEIASEVVVTLLQRFNMPVFWKLKLALDVMNKWLLSYAESIRLNSHTSY